MAQDKHLERLFINYTRQDVTRRKITLVNPLSGHVILQPCSSVTPLCRALLTPKLDQQRTSNVFYHGTGLGQLLAGTAKLECEYKDK
eukprot:scaffold4124_cov29-Prasinocladus_malaysianus.AAC.3